jgi:hypothetical protein
MTHFKVLLQNFPGNTFGNHEYLSKSIRYLDQASNSTPLEYEERLIFIQLGLSVLNVRQEI